MLDIRACRGCLATDCRLSKLGPASSKIYSILVGEELKDDNIFPTYFCVTCRAFIKKSLIFRRRAKRAYFVMKEILNVRHSVTYQEIKLVDKNKTNLQPIINYSSPLKNSCYCIEHKEDDSTEGNNEIKDNIEEKEYLTEYIPDVTGNAIAIVNIKSKDAEDDMDIKKFLSETKFEGFEENNDVAMECDNFESNEDNIMDTFQYSEDEISPDSPEAVKTETDGTEEVKTVTNINLEKAQKQFVRRFLMTPNKQSYYVKMLMHTEIKVLSKQEQITAYNALISMDQFKYSLFKCMVCVTTYDSINELKCHMDCHNIIGLTLYRCDVCMCALETEQDLNIHLADKHLYQYTCTLCIQVLYTFNDLINHFTSKHEDKLKIKMDEKPPVEDEKRFRSFHFPKHFEVKEMTPEEIRLTVDPTKQSKEVMGNDNSTFPVRAPYQKYQCEHCFQWFRSVKQITRHLDIMHKYSFKCKQCGHVAYNKVQASQHRTSHLMAKEHMSTQKGIDFVCDECGDIFRNSKTLTLHKNLFHKNENYTDHCITCGKGFYKFRALIFHQLRVHQYLSLTDPLLGSAEFACLHCNIQFASLKALHTHQLVINHAEGHNLEFACVPCKTVFNNEEETKEHRVICDYAMLCAYCEATVICISEYRSHLHEEHPGCEYRNVTYREKETHELCDLCGAYVPKAEVSSHRLSHERAALCCRYCEHVPSSAAGLAIHVLSTHATRPYVCRVCGTRAQKRNELKKHLLRVHLQDLKNYKCKICDKTFSHFETYFNHSRTIHKKDVKKKKIKIHWNPNRLTVYPHMKIDATLIPDEILEDIEGDVVTDYLDETKIEPIKDIKKYFIKPAVTEDLEIRQKRTNNAAKIKVPAVLPKTDVTDLKLDGSEVRLNDECCVVDRDGQQFVVINNIVYRIEDNY